VLGAGAPVTLAPGEVRHLTLQAVECRCARCLHTWVAVALTEDLPAIIPSRCAGCKKTNWRKPAGKQGWPKGKPRPTR
jgi:hypothetical protein